jgi:hypothetical protein
VGDDRVIGALVAFGQVVFPDLGRGADAFQPVAVQPDGTGGADRQHLVGLGWRKAGRGEVGQHHGGGARGGLHRDQRVVLPRDVLTRPPQVGRRHRQVAKQHAQGVEMMDQHLIHQQAPFAQEEGLADQRGTGAGGVGQQARGQQGDLALADGADRPLGDPARGVAVVSAEAPVLMHHQARAGGVRDKRLGFRQSGRQRLLAQHRHATRHPQADQFRVEFSGGGDVDRIGLFRVKHGGGRRVGTGHAELGGAARGIGGHRVGDGDDLHVRPQFRPGDQMVTTDHAGTDEGDAHLTSPSRWLSL